MDHRSLVENPEELRFKIKISEDELKARKFRRENTVAIVLDDDEYRRHLHYKDLMQREKLRNRKSYETLKNKKTTTNEDI